jgi:tetratricopeptide (TPR) repeat protein
VDREHRRNLKHDKFVDEVGALSVRARENQRVLVTIAAVAVAVALVAYGVYFYRSTREQKAQDALASAIETMDSPLIPAATPGQPPQPTPPNAKFHSDAERLAAAEKQFRDVQTKFSGSDAADVANLYLARIDASRGDAATARKLLDAFIKEHPKNILAGSARYDLYQIRIDAGEAQQVAQELTAELAKPDNQALPADSMLALLAHAYDAQGSADKSREAYRRIVTEYPDSPYVLEAQRRVGSGPAA